MSRQKARLQARIDEFEAGKYAGEEATEFFQWLVDNGAVETAGPDYRFLVDLFTALGLVKSRPERAMQ